MKFDKETILTLVVCLVLIVLWGPLTRMIWPPKPVSHATAPGSVGGDAKKGDPKATEKKVLKKPLPSENVAVSASTAAPSEVAESPKSAPKNDSSVCLDGQGVVKCDVVPDPFFATLENDFVKVEIDLSRAAVSSVTLKQFLDADRKQEVAMLRHVADGALRVFPEKGEWVVVAANAVVDSRRISLARKVRRVSDGALFKIDYEWSLRDNYMIGCDVAITNVADGPLEIGRVLVSAGGMSPIKHMAGDKVLRETFDLDYYDLDKGKVVSEAATRSGGFFGALFGGKKPAKRFCEVKKAKTKWVGAANRYFASILVPTKPFDSGVLLSSETVGEGKDAFSVASAAGIVRVSSLPPGGVDSMSFKYYAGPKDITYLAKLDPDASKIMKLYFLGMRFLEPLSRLLLSMLIWLKNWCGSYGLGIILLTFIVKTVFWPVTHRANVSMRKMQKVQPMIQEIRKKYKSDPQRMNMEIMKLYKEYKVNPLGGCLPILLQMPVFFALYATLSGTVEPRQTSFLWMSDLSMPDTIFTIPIPGFPLPIRPLMLMMTATMVLQQKLTPSAADPAQQKMMMMMPIVMLVMLYGLPSGLTLYWTVSQFISIAQLLVNQRLEKRAALREQAAA